MNFQQDPRFQRFALAYAVGGVLTAGAVLDRHLNRRGTNSKRYNELAAQDPTGVLGSDVGRGVSHFGYGLGKAVLNGFIWPYYLLNRLGRDSRNRS